MAQDKAAAERLRQGRGRPAAAAAPAAAAPGRSSAGGHARRRRSSSRVDKISSGDTAWMLTSTALVLMMTIPGLALFYGGMVRKKNVLATLMQSFAITCLVTVLWVDRRVQHRVHARAARSWAALDRLFLQRHGVHEGSGQARGLASRR